MSIRFDPPFRLRHVFSSKIIAPNREPLVFSERTPEAYANLSCGRFVLCGERITVDSRVCRIRFDPLFRLRHVFSSKSIAPNREPAVFQNELRKRVRTSLVGGSFFVGNGEGIEELAEPIFVRAQPFYGSAPRTLQWPARSVPGRRTLRHFIEMKELRFLFFRNPRRAFFRGDFSNRFC